MNGPRRLCLFTRSQGRVVIKLARTKSIILLPWFILSIPLFCSHPVDPWGQRKKFLKQRQSIFSFWRFLTDQPTDKVKIYSKWGQNNKLYQRSALAILWMFVLNCDSNDVVDNDDNQTKNLIHPIKQARNVCYRGIKPGEGGLIGTHFCTRHHGLLSFFCTLWNP